MRQTGCGRRTSRVRHPLLLGPDGRGSARGELLLRCYHTTAIHAHKWRRGYSSPRGSSSSFVALGSSWVGSGGAGIALLSSRFRVRAPAGAPDSADQFPPHARLTARAMDPRTTGRRSTRPRSRREVSWYQPAAVLSLSMIRRVAPDHSAAIIDVGGGASRLIDGLLAAGYSSLTVLDVSAAALAEASGRLAADARRVRWLEQTSSTRSCLLPHMTSGTTEPCSTS